MRASRSATTASWSTSVRPRILEPDSCEHPVNTSLSLRIRSSKLTAHGSRLVLAVAVALALALVASACAPKPPVATSPQLLAPPADPCVLAREDAAQNPRLDVERVPTPVKMDPAPIKSPCQYWK